MARFKFHLEPVLRQRAAREDEAEQALALAYNEYKSRCAVLQDTKQRLEEALVPDEKKLDIFENMHLSFYLESLSEKITCQEKDVNYAANIVERSRKEAVRARQDRQVLEKLKEKHLQKYKREEESREQKVVDELALYSHLRTSIFSQN